MKTCTSLPRLEQLESQAALAQLLVDCSHHLGVARKELLNLGPRPAKDAVAQVLQSVSTWVVGYRTHVKTANALLQSHKREVLGKPKGKAKAKAKYTWGALRKLSDAHYCWPQPRGPFDLKKGGQTAHDI